MFHSLARGAALRRARLDFERVTSRGLLRCLLSFVCLFFLSCSSQSGITVIVNVSGVPSGTQLLRLSATLNDAEVRPTEEVSASAVEIAYALPEGASGNFVVQVRALGEGGCAAAVGRGEAVVGGAARIAVAVSLVISSPPLCSVEVRATGNGTVTSNPTGLSCGSRCVVEIPSGSRIVLSASPGGRAYFAGWTGACAGYAPCELTIDHPISVGADFFPELCSPGLCWESPLPTGIDLHAIYGVAESDLWAVGEAGYILHYDGSAFSLVQSPTKNTLRAIWGLSSNDIWAVGVNGTLLHYNGTSWMVVPSPNGATSSMFAIAGSSSNNIWAVGAAGALWHYDGNWSTASSGVAYDLNGVYVSAAEVLLVGSGGQVLRRDAAQQWNAVGLNAFALRGISGKADGSVFTVGDSGTMQHFDGNTLQTLAGYPGTQLRAIYARAEGDAWVAGSEGGLFHFDGTTLARQAVPTSQTLNGVFASSKDSAWAVGDRGTIVHYDGRAVSAYGSSGVPDASDYRGVSGTSANDLWAVGNNNSIVHNSGQGWVPVASGQTSNVSWRGVYAISPSDAWVVGNQGGSGAAVIVHWNGSRFTALPSPLPLATLNAVSASGPNNVWIGGLGGAILRWNGSAFSTYSAATAIAPQIYSVAAVSPQEVWFGCAPTLDAVSGLTAGCVLSWNGSTVTLVRGLPIGTMVGAAVAASNDIWFVGYNSAAPAKGLALRIQNGALGSMHDFQMMAPDLYGIGVRSGSDVWVSGSGGTILHTTNAIDWNSVNVGLSSTTLFGITPAGPDAMTVVGGERTILRLF